VVEYVIRCINLDNVRVLLNNLKAIRVCKKESLHLVITVVLYLNKVLNCPTTILIILKVR
jgi:hypothetical protein